jgi:hypothetical protein
MDSELASTDETRGRVYAENVAEVLMSGLALGKV